MRLALRMLAILMVNVVKMKVEGAFNDTAPSHLTCYSKTNLEGETISFVSDVRNLVKDNDFNGTISSCSVTGIWIFYNRPGFKGKINAIYGQNSSFIPSISGNISSIRKVGSSNNYSSELVLFEKPFFRKTRACNVLGDKKGLPDCTIVRSAVVIGFSNWTIIGEPLKSDADRNGSLLSLCLKSNRNGAAFFPKLNKKLNVTSIKQGCEGKVLYGEAEIKENEEIDCQCNSYTSKGCKMNGDCICIDPSFTGRNCTTKNIVLPNFPPGRKSLNVTCSGKCGDTYLQAKVTDNNGGKLLMQWYDTNCFYQAYNENKCEGNTDLTTFLVHLRKEGSSCTVNLTISATKLANVFLLP